MNEQTAQALVSAIRSISHGDISGPTGLEMLSMSISGDGTSAPLAPAVEAVGTAIAEGLHAIANSISQLAQVLEDRE